MIRLSVPGSAAKSSTGIIKFKKDSKTLLWFFWTEYTVPVFKKSSNGGSIQRFLLKLWRFYLVPIGRFWRSQSQGSLLSVDVVLLQ
jgi:hypothetical protein